MAVVQPAQTEAQEALVVPHVEVAEGSRVTGLASFDQGAVALEVDVVAEACELDLAERHSSVPPRHSCIHQQDVSHIMPETARFPLRNKHFRNGARERDSAMCVALSGEICTRCATTCINPR